MLLVAAIPAALALVLWALVDLERFVVFAVLGATILPASLAKPFGTNVAGVDILLLIALAAWLIANSVGGAPDPWLRQNRMLWPALLFLGVNAASVAWSVKPRSTIIFTVQLTELTILFPLVFASIPRTAASIRQGLTMLVVVTAVMAVITIVVYATHAKAHVSGTYLPGLNKNGLGSFLGAGVVVSYALLSLARRSGARMWLALMTAVDIAGLAASGSRGAIIGTGVALLAFGFLLRYRRVLVVSLTAVLAVLYVGAIAPQRAPKRITSGGYDSGLLRTVTWRDATKKIEQRPWLGTGARTYEDTLLQFGATLPDPNNLFLLTWAELGIPGLVALSFLLFRFAQLLVRARRLPRESSVLAVGAGGVALSLLVHFQVDVSWSRGETTLEFVMIGVMLALTRLPGSIDQASAATSTVDPQTVQRRRPIAQVV